MMAERARLKLVKLIERLSDEAASCLYNAARKMFPEQFRETKPRCPHCGGEYVVKNGHKCGKQEYLCKNCGKTFVSTTNTIMANSHQPKEVWEELIDHTLSGKSLDFTANCLGLTHDCVFHMRHKFLTALIGLRGERKFSLGEVSEVDETFVLDSYKGSPVPENACRSARNHGESAEKRGISREYVCICTGVQRGGSAMAETVNRAKPSSEEVQAVFSGHILDGTLVLCDGLKSYKSLEKVTKCTIKDVNSEDEKGFYNLNSVNAFHSFIKARYAFYRGVATKYLNRYNTLFSAAYKHSEDFFNHIADLLLSVSCTNRFVSYARLRTHTLLCI